MADSNEPVFRAAKRRKVFRKRVDEDGALEEGDELGQIASEETREDADERPVFQRARLGASGRKYGIAFSSAGTPRSAEQDSSQALALVSGNPTTRDETAALIATGRFVAPTGLVGPVEDRHM